MAPAMLTRQGLLAHPMTSRLQCQQPCSISLPMRPARVVSQAGRVEKRQPSARTVTTAGLAGALLAAGAPLTLAAAALADTEAGAEVAQATQDASQAVQQAGDAVQQAAAQAPSPIEILLVLSPGIAYGLFSLYRAKVNPRAKLSDFAFIMAGLAIVGNLISIVAFKVRFF